MKYTITPEDILERQEAFKNRLHGIIKRFGYKAVVRHAGWTQDLYSQIPGRMMVNQTWELQKQYHKETLK